MLLLWHKILLFSVPALLATGAGVAYHDGVMADESAKLTDADVGKSVTVKGTVVWVDRDCDQHDDGLDRNVECFALREAGTENSFIGVTTDHAAPATDEVVVARGVLKFRYEMKGGSTSWPGTCWDAGSYGSGCTAGGSAAWSGFAAAWVDATNVDEAWVFR